MTFWAAGAAVAGSLISSSIASSSASDAQASQERGAAASDATQRYFYDTTRSDNASFLRNGTAASNKLSYLLGLGGTSSGGSSMSQAAQAIKQAFPTWSGGNEQEIVQSFLSEAPKISAEPGYAKANGWDYGAPELQKLQNLLPMAQQAQQSRNAPDDGMGGSLTRKFSASDLASDVPYQTGMQFGLDQGTQGINNQASATGSMLSGATLKALTRFGNDYGNQKAGDAYNRFNTDNTNTYNRLAGISGSGQTASAQVGSAGMNAGNNISQSQIGVGNARGASSIAQGNALAGGLTGSYNNYQNNRLMSAYESRTAGGGSGGWGGQGGWGGGGRTVPDYLGAEY